jgi:putative hydroxymethylpyrimidine transporter CytX
MSLSAANTQAGHQTPPRIKKTPMVLLWLGAAISISEIFTGGMLAPLGLARGFLAILAGHLTGTGFLAYAGYISFVRGKNAMDSAACSFGSAGVKIIALCNVVQLTGWTIIMVVQAASALTGMLPRLPFSLGALGLSLLVLIWALIFGSPAGRGLHGFIVILLSILSVVLFFEAASGGRGPYIPGEAMRMGLAIELSMAMPVSWLPLVGDYSCESGSPAGAALMPFTGYFLGSMLMYMLGLFIAVRGGGDIFTFIAGSRFRLAAGAVVLFSTLTTAFLDLYSAVVSSRQFIKPKNKKLPLIIAGLFTLGASSFFPVERYGQLLESFLITIGMVFVPVYALLFMDFLCRARETRTVSPANLIIAAAGMAAYWFFTRIAFFIPSLLSMALVCLLYLLVHRPFVNRNS